MMGNWLLKGGKTEQVNILRMMGASFLPTEKGTTNMERQKL